MESWWPSRPITWFNTVWEESGLEERLWKVLSPGGLAIVTRSLLGGSTGRGGPSVVAAQHLFQTDHCLKFFPGFYKGVSRTEPSTDVSSFRGFLWFIQKCILKFISLRGDQGQALESSLPSPASARGQRGGAGQVQGLLGSGVNGRRASPATDLLCERQGPQLLWASKPSPEDHASQGLSGSLQLRYPLMWASPGFLLLPESVFSPQKAMAGEEASPWDQTPGLATHS